MTSPLDTCVCGHDRSIHWSISPKSQARGPCAATWEVGKNLRTTCGCKKFKRDPNDGPAELKKLLQF